MRPLIATRTPASTSASATPLPMPPLAAVTRAVLPARLRFISLFRNRVGLLCKTLTLWQGRVIGAFSPDLSSAISHRKRRDQRLRFHPHVGGGNTGLVDRRADTVAGGARALCQDARWSWLTPPTASTDVSGGNTARMAVSTFGLATASAGNKFQRVGAGREQRESFGRREETGHREHAGRFRIAR